MCARRIRLTLAVAAVLTFSGCGYVHIGPPRPPATVTVVGDERLVKENSDLRLEREMLQQELALTRAQGEALRMTIENRAADGDTSRRLVDRLNETSRELAALRANYVRLQTERDQAMASASEAGTLRTQLGATEEKLADSLRTFTRLRDEIATLRTAVASSRTENAALSEQVKVITASNDEARAALAQLNADLLAQKNARFEAEQDANLLRTELATIAPNSSVLARQRTGAAGQARSLVAEHAEETAALKAQLGELRRQVAALETERGQLQVKLAAAGKPAAMLAKVEAQLAAAGADNQKLATQKAELENQLARLQAAPPPAQVLRDQLRSVQARAAALTEENARLKEQLGAGAPPATTASAAAALATAPAGKPEESATSATERPPTVVVEANRIDLGSDSAPPVETSRGSSITLNRGASTVNATLVTSPPGRSRIEVGGQRVHVIAGGDTLAKISSQYYGTPARWADILAANRDVLGETNNLIVGRTLRIP